MDIFLCSLSIFAMFVFTFRAINFYYKSNAFSRHINLPPGKFGWPIIGETFDFLNTGWKGKPEKFIIDRMKKYSSQIFKTSIFLEKIAVVCDVSGNKLLFSNEDKLVNVWFPDSVNKIFPSTTKSSSIEESKKMRKMIPTFFKPEALQRYIGMMDSIAQKHMKTSWEGEKEIRVFPLSVKYTFWVACKVFLSIEDPDEVAKLAKPFSGVVKGIYSFPLNFPGTAFNRGIKAANIVRKELVETIKRRKNDLVEKRSDKKHDILSHMLETSDENGEFMDESEIADKIIALLIGGHDTASSTITFTVKYLAEIPHIYNEVYKEQMEIARSKKEGDLLTWDDIQKMKYSWNVVCEVMRIAPPVPGNFKEAIRDFEFSGFSIPKGWKLYWSTNSTHRNPNYFPDPEKFDPTRFEGNGPIAYSYVPFGGGPRMCPGQEYARLEILVFIHHIVKRFRWKKLLPNEKVIVDPMRVPANGLPIRLIPN